MVNFTYIVQVFILKYKPMVDTKEVVINGFTYYADIKNNKLYVDKEKTQTIDFLVLSDKEKEQLKKDYK